MKTLGVTGGIGMGKSTTAALLAERGIAVSDTDDIARQVVEPGQPALSELADTFGREVIGPDGRLQRGILASLVFPHPDARKRLEAILHPRIREVWQAQMRHWASERQTLGVVIIPLLFETEAAGSFDKVLCVACSSATQRTRLTARGWPPDQIEARLAAQWPVEQKMAKADYVIWSEGSIPLHGQQLDRILAAI